MMSSTPSKTCLAFLGAAGGVGVTGAVIETGYAALKAKPAAGGSAPRVCLMDLDFENGALASYPRLWQPWTQAALMASDRSVILTEMTIPALHATRERLTQIEAVTKPNRPMDIVINKHERRSFRATITTSDAQQALGRDAIAFIAVDPATPRNAMNCGQPAGSLQADSRYAKDMAALMKTLMSPKGNAGLKAAG